MLTVLASVYEKDGLVPFLKALAKLDEIVVYGTDSTSRHLSENGIPCKTVHDLTGYPEILGGRVKTLHPRVFAGLLARPTQEDAKVLQAESIPAFDIAIVNLYPFAAKSKENLSEDKLIEYIDIGGVALIRAAAKNFARVAIICDPSQFERVLDGVANKKFDIDLRRSLALEAFNTTTAYDGLIASTLSANTATDKTLPQTVNLNLRQQNQLRYGENPHSAATWYQPTSVQVQDGDLQNFPPFEQIQGKEMSANNIVDCYCLVKILRDAARGKAAACIIKHNNPCGVALGKDSEEAFDKAYATDPLSAFGGIYGFSAPVSKALAEKIVQGFVEVVAAPAFDQDALKVFASKKNIRVLKLKSHLLDPTCNTSPVRIKDVGDFGLILERDIEAQVEPEGFTLATGDKELADRLKDDIAFAWQIVKHLTSNAIAIVKDTNCVGFGIGQTSRVASVKLAVEQAGKLADGAVMASDAFFPNIDSIQEAHKKGVKVVVQPGGSIKDKEVIAACEELGITMLLTGQRCFRH